jgi:hypothetical protein
VGLKHFFEVKKTKKLAGQGYYVKGAKSPQTYIYQAFIYFKVKSLLHKAFKPVYHTFFV